MRWEIRIFLLLFTPICLLIPRVMRGGCRLKNLRFSRLQRDQRLHLWYIGKRKQGFLRNHAIPQFTFLTPVGNRCITPCVCVKELSRSRGVIPTAGGLYVYKGTVFCRNIRRRHWFSLIGTVLPFEIVTYAI